MSQLELVVTLTILCLLLSFAVYRVTYFLLVDSLIEEPRKALIRRLTEGGDPDRADWPLFLESTKGWRKKATQLATCPYCMSVWVAAAAMFICWPTIIPHPDGNWLVWWLLTWMVIATGGLVFWAIIEGHDG